MKLNKVLFLLLLVLLIWSCKKNPETPEVEIQPEEIIPVEVEVPEEKIETLVSSVVLAPSAGLNLLGRDFKMHRMSSLSSGNILDLLLVNGETQLINVENSDSNDVYYHCVYDNVDFWIYSDYVAPESKPAIIVEPEGSLKFSQIIAVSLKESQDFQVAQDNQENQVLIYYFDKAQDKVCNRMIAPEKISTCMDDVEMASIIQKLRVTTRATPRNELFLRAEKLNPSPVMKKILDAEKTEKISYDYQEVLKAMPGAKYVVNVEELNTVDQSKDPFSN